MSKIRFRLAEYLQAQRLTPEKLVEAIDSAFPPEKVYHLVKHGSQLQQIDLPTLAVVMQGLRKLMGFPVGIEEVMQFIPDLTPEEMNPETNPFYERDMYGEIPPYDWGDVDPLEGTKPVRYIPGIGMVVDDEEVAPTNRENIKEFTRITFNSVMGEKPCIRNLPIAVETVIAMIASHYSTAEICKKYPDLEEEDINEALAYAMWRIEERKSPKKADKEVEKVGD